jgi:predicted transcriptional regulator
VTGLLTRSDLLAALARQGQTEPVSNIMRRDFVVVDSYDMLETAFARLQECGCPILPVTRNGNLVGLVTSENVGEFLMIQAALGSARQATTSR